jgi:exopolysaccharide biosynthesis polyprenyl glycosylphosphotransferase
VSRTRFVALSLLLDALFVNASIIAAFFLRFGGQLPAFNFGAYAALWPLLTVAYLASGYVYGLYEPERTEDTWAVVRAVLFAATLGTILTTAIAFFAGPRFFSFSRLAILIAWVLEILTLIGWRLAVLKLTPIKWPEQRVLVVGTDALACDVAAEFTKRSSWGYKVVGLVSQGGVRGESAGASAQICGFPVLGDAANVTDLIRTHAIHRIIIASPVSLREIVEDMAISDEMDVRVDVIPELYEIFIGSVDAVVGDIPLMMLTRPAVPGWYSAVKRFIDIAGALVLLVLLSPVLLLAAIAVVVSSGAPVFFAQERSGRDLKPFNVLKFRTMVRDAEKLTGPVLATEDDPRVTRVGRFLRRFRIDELPQLANILLGEMSFVGPRPERPFFVEQFIAEIPGYRERFRVKPGVTGMAQVNGSYATTPERKLKYDLIYIYHQNLLMDLQIVFETLRVVLTGKGAR